ncbi:hypothetical protein AB0N64_16105 [Microbacterium sp. NPDC089318]
MSQPAANCKPRVPVSVVCVYNSPDVLSECLTASVVNSRDWSGGSEYLPVDNTARQYASAGAALNYGVSLARNEVVVFVHQDVVFHSVAALEEAAGALITDSAIGVMGATGVTHAGRTVGLIRDRIVLAGEQTPGVAEVDSVDEVLFMARREQLLRYPLTEEKDLAWHAYAVEYGARQRTLGRRTVVADIPLTHNSLTINLERLAEAHQWIAAAYPDQLPLQTTCGTVKERSDSVAAVKGVLKHHIWRYRWLRESLAAHRLRRLASPRPAAVLGDIRRDLDDICAAAGLTRAVVINAVPDSSAGHPLSAPVELNRRNVRFSFLTSDQASVAGHVSSQYRGSTVAVTNITGSAVKQLVEAVGCADILLGFHETTGAWMLTGPAVRAARAYYRKPRSTPVAMRAG